MYHRHNIPFDYKEDFASLIVELLGMGYDAEEARNMANEILENEYSE